MEKDEAGESKWVAVVAEREEGERWRNPANELIAEYGANAFKSLARSHPSVLRRWHADLRVDPQTGRVERA